MQSDAQQGDCQIAFGDPAWTDYDFTCQARVVAGRGEVGQTFRVTPAGRYEWVRGRWTFDWDSAGSVTAQGLERVRSRQARRLDPNRWYTPQVRVRGRTIECLADGASVFKFEHDRHKDGRVGLRTFGTHARFRDLKVTDPAGVVLFEGLPELPPQTADWIADS